MAYTTIDDPSAHFQTKIYSGQNSQLAVTNDGNSNLKPDWLWIKSRNDTDIHHITNSTLGTDLYLQSNNNAGETSSTGHTESFDTNGFTVNGPNDVVNTNGGLYVAWQWKAGGGTTSSNSDGSITSTVQADTTSGFSIITYTGTGSAATIGHGLGVVPAMIIVKCRNETNTNWTVYHKNSNATPQNYVLELNNTNTAFDNDRFNDTAPTSSVFSVNAGSSTVNKSSNTYVAYCFAEIQGYSKFGSYVGNGTSGTDGTFIYTGFKPAMIMTKRASSADAWVIYDNKRDPDNPCQLALAPNSTAADDTFANWDFVSNGFKSITGNSQGANGVTFVYWAFAESPLVTSTGIPTTAR